MLITVRTPPEDQTQEIVASPAYSSTDEVTFSYGDADSKEASSAASATSNSWQTILQKINMEPGVYKLNSVDSWVFGAQASNCDAIIFRLYKKVGTDLVYQTGTEIDMTADQPAISSSSKVTTDLSDTSFTIATSEEWYYSVSLHNIETTGTNVGHRTTAPGIGPDDETYLFRNQVADVSSLPTTWDIDGKAYETFMARTEVTFKTSQRILYSGTYSSADIRTIPIIDAGQDSWIKFEDAVVADGEAFTCLFQNFGAGGVLNTLETMALDFGATDQITYNGNSLALAVGEAGQTFDLGVNIRPDTDKSDLFYIDKTDGQGGTAQAYDIATISHATKNGSARGLDYAMATRPVFLNMTGTASVAKVIIGWEPCIIFGDSQAGTSDGEPQRLGVELPIAFTYERMWWLAAISGNLITTTAASTAGYLRYKSGTPGLGDITAMTGAILCFCSYGVNDLSGISTDETKRDSTVALMMERISFIMNDWTSASKDSLMIGQPPYDGTNASEQEAQAVRQFNRGLQGIAAATRTPFYTPWSTLVDGSYEVAIPVSNKTYIQSGNEPHYLAAGSQLVSANAVTQYELGTTPDRINQS